MTVLTNLIVVVVLQYTHISSDYIICLKLEKKKPQSMLWISEKVELKTKIIEWKEKHCP